MSDQYTAAKRKFQSLRNRLRSGIALRYPVSDKNSELVRNVVREQFPKDTFAARAESAKQQRSKAPKVPSLKAGAKAGEKKPGVQETGVIIAGDVPTDRTEFIQSMVSKIIKPEGSAQVNPEFKRRAHRKRKQTKHSKA